MKLIKLIIVLLLPILIFANSSQIQNLLILNEVSKTISKLPSDSNNKFLIKIFRTQKNIDNFDDPNSVSLEIKAISYYANLLTNIIPQYTSLQKINNTNLDISNSIYVKNINYYFNEFQKHSKNLKNKADFVIALYNIEKMYKIFRQLLLSQSYNFLNSKINNFDYPADYESIKNETLLEIFSQIDKKSKNLTNFINSLLNNKENYLMNFSAKSIKNFKTDLEKYGYKDLINRYNKINNINTQNDVENTFKNINQNKQIKKEKCTEIFPGVKICEH